MKKKRPLALRTPTELMKVVAWGPPELGTPSIAARHEFAMYIFPMRDGS
jgi:hypothetical protein